MTHTVLIVDDEQEIRDGLCSFDWKSLGFFVVGDVSNGAEALAFVEQTPVDVILCDIRMETMDGIEFARHVFERKIHSKIVFLTGYKDMELIRAAMRYGCFDYLLKPTRFHQLTEVFSEIGRQLEEEWRDEVSQRLRYDESKISDFTIQVAQKYIESHLSDVSLDNLASYLRITPSYLSKTFKEKFGENFSEFCLRKKMDYARMLLKDPRMNINEIASQVGYTNPANFSRAFRTQFGESPKEFRLHVCLGGGSARND